MGQITKHSADGGNSADDPPIEDPPTESCAEAVPNLNEATIIGTLSGAPDQRPLPSGSIAASFSLTVRTPGEKTTSVPVVWYDPPKRVGTWKIGDVIAVRGPVVRRFFQGAGGLGSSTEIVVRHGDLWRRKRAASKLLARSIDRLQAAGDVCDSS